ncbi:hypothetical protein ANO11243_038370 [Dothideomycetidae sp. 11243]|nr:hypothetical protein ANO11243_038370 [fungal sp. No.11243]
MLKAVRNLEINQSMLILRAHRSIPCQRDVAALRPACINSNSVPMQVRSNSAQRRSTYRVRNPLEPGTRPADVASTTVVGWLGRNVSGSPRTRLRSTPKAPRPSRCAISRLWAVLDTVSGYIACLLDQIETGGSPRMLREGVRRHVGVPILVAALSYATQAASPESIQLASRIPPFPATGDMERSGVVAPVI